MRKFIALQEFRLMNSFAVDFNLSEGTLSCRVPHLILQSCNGISAEALNILDAEQSPNQKTHSGFSGIGVANIKERLRLYYGAAGKVICESDGKTFTKISVVLPAER